MGMAASQARYLSLFARKSNLEYQAQQINQERSVLSQQCTAMYNSLLAMQVPTPPSTSEYTTIKYTGVQGATTITLGKVKPSGEKYCVEIITSDTGDSLNKDYGSASYTKNSDGITTIAGEEAYTFEDAKDKFSEDFSWGRYEEAIRNSNILNPQNEPYKSDDFLVYIEKNDSGIKTVKFVLASEVTKSEGFVTTYSYISNGTFDKSEEIENCDLNFDGQGMITQIKIPFYSEDGTLLGTNDIKLTAEKTTDNAAYQDAYNQYEYAQYEYDKKQEEINAKTEIIQQQDRNLELKLQRLDTERQQITAEIDALKTVIKDNVDKSFKTFSG